MALKDGRRQAPRGYPLQLRRRLQAGDGGIENREAGGVNVGLGFMQNRPATLEQRTNL